MHFNTKLTFITFYLLINVHCYDFDELNIDPTRTTKINPENLLTAVLRDLRTIPYGYVGNIYAQYLSQTGLKFESRYVEVERSNDFNSWYSGPLINLDQIIELNVNEETREEASLSGANHNQIAVAEILKSFIYLQMTDRWGPLPYSVALQGRKNFKPYYDSQETVYKDILSILEYATQMIKSDQPVKGDFLLEGDMSRWKDFAHSLQMIAALRISNVRPDLARDAFIRAFNSGVISSTHENIVYPFLDEVDNENPWFYFFRTHRDITLSNVLIDRLVDLKDPRLYSFADPAQSDSLYRGFPYGVAVTEIDPFAVSYPHSILVRGRTTPLPLLTHAQILFSKAEAAYRGWTEEDPEFLYYEAIKSSMEQWDAFHRDTFQNYIGHPDVKWVTDRAFELIGQQKWIALFMQGFEAWAEWRRLGYPDLKPAPDALNQSKQIPVRLPFPTSERDLNYDNWKFAVDTWLNGEDGFDSKLWWDVD